MIVMDGLNPVGILTETDIKLKLSRSSLSYRLIFKKYLVDALAYIVFWSWISVLIQVFIVRIPFKKFVLSSFFGFIATILAGGIFGSFLDKFRTKLRVD